MLIKNTIDEEVSEVTYTFRAECICDRCHKKFWRESEPQDEEPDEEDEIEFLKGDFSLCYHCRKYIEEFKKRQMCLI